MEIWFLRHGETDWNRESRIQGSTASTDLTPFGVRLAELTRDGLLAAGVSFDRAFTSPYRRAVHTAEIVAGGLGLAAETDDRLREMSFGEYEGTFHGEGKYADGNIRACFEDPVSYVARGGAETFEGLCARAEEFIRSAAALGERGAGRVLAVTHGTFMRSVVAVAAKTPLADFWRGRQPNCCVHVVSADPHGISLAARARTFYPDELLSMALSV